MDPTAFIETVVTVPVAITAVIVGAVQEVMKRATLSWKPSIRSTPWFKTIMGIAPLIAGVLLGWYIIPADGVAPPEVMGLLAGAFSSKAYDAVAPYTKHFMNGRKAPDGDSD